MPTDPAAPATRAPGRPKDAGKRAAIIAAAHGLFTGRGFEAVTMDAVAAAANVSKMTVYSHFGDKETLFEGVVRASSQTMVCGLANLQDGSAGLEEALVQIGRAFLSVALSREIAAVHLALMGVLAKNPDLARRFYQAGPGHVRATLAGIIAAGAARGELVVDDPMLAADDLVSLWQGEMPKLLSAGLAEPITPEQADQRARRGTAVFLRAYRAAPPSPDAAPQ